MQFFNVIREGPSAQTRGHQFKLEVLYCRTERNFFSVRIIKLWNKLPIDLVSSLTVNIFGAGLQSGTSTFFWTFSATNISTIYDFRLILNGAWGRGGGDFTPPPPLFIICYHYHQYNLRIAGLVPDCKFNPFFLNTDTTITAKSRAGTHMSN